jgi:outer membrane protein assembly factor BamD (BamD/ComL family)
MRGLGVTLALPRGRLRGRFAAAGAVCALFVATQALSQPPPKTAAPVPPAPAKAAPAPAPAAKAPAAPAPAPRPAAPAAAPTPPRPGAPPLTAEAVPASAVRTGCSARSIAGGSVPTLSRDKMQGPKAPTPAQLATLAELQKEAALYEADAKAYRNAITRIVRHHYEEKRKRIIHSLDREIKIEQDGLRAARDEAIRRQEAFVAKYSGDEAHPKYTPDGLFRLAALYEEKEREAIDNMDLAAGAAPPEPDLSKAVAVYKRLVAEYPKYDEVAAVLYHLGHAYQDMGRLEESQQVFRALVCTNHFPYPVPADPKDPDKDLINRLPQDHESEWWLGWMSRHPEPSGRGGGGANARRGPQRQTAAASADEEKYRDPYPEDCQAVAQKTAEGEDPRYVAEVWWRIGDYHFDEIDPWGGPYNLNRAESAYRQSMRFKKPPVFGVSMYKLAWTFFKQQRYQDAVKQFVELLHYTDQREKETGNRGDDFRSEAYAYIAGSLTYVDFEGPAPDDPYIPRNDVFDLESDPAIIEQKMHVAIDRVQDAALIPQDKKWTVEIYKALAYEFKEYNQFHNLIEIDELMLAKWPMHRDAPMVQNQIAETYEALAASTRGEEQAKYAKQALEARGKLVNYVATPGSIPEWVDKNKDDPEAIRAAERLVRGGLQRAAADHTNAARRSVQTARAAADEEEKRAAFEEALRQYELAAKAWGGYLLQDENAEDSYESRFWLADALSNSVIIKVQLGRMPNNDEIELARCTAREVRDSNEDDKYLQPAALMVVRIAQQIVAANYQRHEETNGAQGFPELKELEEKGEGDNRTFVKKDIPQPVRDMVASFDEYVARVPVEKDPYKNHDHFAYSAGEIPFLYGHFDEARKRLQPIYMAQCGKTKYGYLAWEKLITMANREGKFEESRALAKASKDKSCAVTEDQKTAQAGIADPTLQRGFFQEAAQAYKAAQAMKDGPERRKAWRRAAELYEGALREAPHRDEAPEAAILGASAYKQIGDYDKAIAMYELFIKEYGKEETLNKLEKGGKGAQPDKKKYEERVKYLKVAYDALAEAYVLFFDYRRAAATYDTIAAQNRFSDDDQRVAARNAVFLYANMGDRAKTDQARQAFFKLNPPAEQRAEVDWLIAEADLKQWDERGPNNGTNAQARTRATASMDGYYRKFQNDRSANAYTVQAAYYAAKTRRLSNDPTHKRWCDNTITAFDSYKASAGNDDKGHNKALGSIQADMAAECEYRDIDEDLKRSYDYDTGHHRYKGVITDVTKQFKDDVEKDAKTHFDRLQNVITKYESRRWAVAARARQGSLYDSARTGLYNAREPELKLYTAQEERLLKQLDDLCVNQGSEDACAKHDAFTAKRRATWRESRDRSLADADRAMVAGYVEAILWARAWKVSVDAVDRATARLAFFTDILGDPKLREYSAALTDPGTKQKFSYQDKMFLRMRRGLTRSSPADVMPPPLPVVPQ